MRAPTNPSRNIGANRPNTASTPPPTPRPVLDEFTRHVQQPTAMVPTQLLRWERRPHAFEARPRTSAPNRRTPTGFQQTLAHLPTKTSTNSKASSHRTHRPHSVQPPPPPTSVHFRVRHDRIDKTGSVTLRHNSRLHHIGIGRAHKHTPVTLLIADLDIRVIATQTGELLRHLTLDPTRDYQPQNQP